MLVTGRAQRLITLPHLETRSDFAGYLAETYRGGFGLLATAGSGSFERAQDNGFAPLFSLLMNAIYMISLEQGGLGNHSMTLSND